MCDTLVSLTDDGVLFAKNSDRDPNESQQLRWFDAADHASGATVDCTWISIPQVAHTHAVMISQPWWMWGAEMGTNEHGVTIGNEAVFTKRPLGDAALLGMDLLRLGLERAATATDAVSVMIDLLERHGQGGACSHERPGFSYHNSFLVADRDGAVVLETAGSAWAIEEVAGRGRSISNGLTIEGFAEAHTDRVRTRVTSCGLRRARTEASAARADGPSSLFTALRDHGDDPAPTWSRVNGALDAPCVHAGGKVTSTQTTSSWVGDLRSTPIHWATGTAAPCTSLFKPIRFDEPWPEAASASVLPGGGAPANRFDPASTWWRHERLHRLVLHDHAASTARFVAERDRTEATWIADPPTTADAFARADELETAWTAELLAAALPDRRPRWLRSLWAGLDDAAGIELVLTGSST